MPGIDRQPYGRSGGRTLFEVVKTFMSPLATKGALAGLALTAAASLYIGTPQRILEHDKVNESLSQCAEEHLTDREQLVIKLQGACRAVEYAFSQDPDTGKFELPPKDEFLKEEIVSPVTKSLQLGIVGFGVCWAAGAFTMTGSRND